MLTIGEKILLTALLGGTVFAFFHPLARRYRIIRAGRPDPLSGHLGKRIWASFLQVAFQKCTLKNERKGTGLMHAGIFYGALTFDLLAVDHILDGFLDGRSLFGQGFIASALFSMANLFSLPVLAGVLFFAFRRFVLRPKAYATTPRDSALIYMFILLAVLTFLFYEVSSSGFRPNSGHGAFLGSWLCSKLGAGGSRAAISFRFRLSWWLHTLAVFSFVSYVPHSKYLHMFAGPFNVLFRKRGPSGSLDPLDLESEAPPGILKATDLTWKDSLDAFACMECGRCQDACPAFASGKSLSPKMVVVNLETHLLRNAQAVAARMTAGLEPLVPGTVSPGEIWACTTCGACRHVCPVEIEHVPKLIGLRRAEVLGEGRFPGELASFFRNLETNSNPWGFGLSKRADWMEGLNIPLLRDHPRAEMVLWAGCMGSYDEGGRRTAKAMADIMTRAGLDFAVLGDEERCCGDAARRLGNEYLYQSLAAENIETFRKYGIRRIVTICPHGYNTFKNEYPKLPGAGGGPAVVSHAEVLHDLIGTNRIRINPLDGTSAVFHDPCYLGRHNRIFKEPREILSRAFAGPLKELPENRDHAFCCGAGGGLMWTEDSAEIKISHLRSEAIIRSGAAVAAAACPFCLTMLQDGLKDKGRSDIRIMDIARIVAERMI